MNINSIVIGYFIHDPRLFLSIVYRLFYQLSYKWTRYDWTSHWCPSKL